MMVMYALERRDQRFVIAFSAWCTVYSSHGFLSGAWPFGAVEVAWCAVVYRFYRHGLRRSVKGCGRWQPQRELFGNRNLAGLSPIRFAQLARPRISHLRSDGGLIDGSVRLAML